MGGVVTLLDACREVMADEEVLARYPDGLAPVDILDEIRKKHGPDAFALCTVIDVADEMRAFFG